MKSIKESCIEFLKDKAIHDDVKEIISPLGTIIYNEVYIYLWVISFYSIILFIMILANLYLLLKILSYVRFKPITNIYY
jgi:hypothetical protein